MRIDQVIKECIDLGKKFEYVGSEFYKNCHLAYDGHAKCMTWRTKSNDKLGVLKLSGDIICANWQEYDPTVYMDFPSACKLSSKEGVYIKRKLNSSEAIIAGLDNKFRLQNGNDAYLYVSDIFATDWHVVK